MPLNRWQVDPWHSKGEIQYCFRFCFKRVNFFFFLFWLHNSAYRTSPTRIKPMPPTVESGSLKTTDHQGSPRGSDMMRLGHLLKISGLKQCLNRTKMYCFSRIINNTFVTTQRLVINFQRQNENVICPQQQRRMTLINSLWCCLISCNSWIGWVSS